MTYFNLVLILSLLGFILFMVVVTVCSWAYARGVVSSRTDEVLASVVKREVVMHGYLDPDIITIDVIPTLTTHLIITPDHR